MPLQHTVKSTQNDVDAVSGYIKQNYRHNIPFAVIKLCISYYQQHIIQTYTKKALTEFLQTKPPISYHWRLKFNNDLDFRFAVAPNGLELRPSIPCSFIEMSMRSYIMSPRIDYFMYCWELKCYDAENEELSVHNFKGAWTSKSHPTKWEFGYSRTVGKLSELRNARKISTKFIIHNCMIKYRNDKQLLYYPSKAENMLKETMKLHWTVNENIVQKLKKFHKISLFDGPIINNLYIHCCPNGTESSVVDDDEFGFSVVLTRFPVDVTRLRGEMIVKSIVDLNESVWKYAVDMSDTDEFFAVGCYQNVFKTRSLDKRLKFDVTLIIEEMYGVDNNEIPREKWIDHNVIINS